MSTTMSEYIRQDVRERLASPGGLPCGLTLPALARHYGTSFTPVREAVRALLAEGSLVKQENGRLAINTDRIPIRGRRRSLVAEPPRDNAALENALAVEIVQKSLRGETAYLREEATARRHAVGRTVIRQALSRLAGRGLVEHVPRCGWRVRAFDEADLIAYLETREALELKALDLARPRLVDADLRRMLTGNVLTAGSPRLDNAIHRYLIEKSKNSYIRDFFDRHAAFYTTLFDFAAPKTHVVVEMARQHRQILTALLAKNWLEARRALTLHIRAQRPIVRELLRQLGGVKSGSGNANSIRRGR
jgi:DNA-binding GntR family transcriptional regulator